MRKFVGAFALLCIVATAVWAADRHNYSMPYEGTMPSWKAGGDSFGVTAVTIGTNSAAATLIKAAVTDRSRRRLCIQNQSATQLQIALSSDTVSLGTKSAFLLGESTSNSMPPIYCSEYSGAMYGFVYTVGTYAAATGKVVVLEETQSIP